MVSKHTKPNAENPQGGIIKKEATIHISNLMLVDPKTGEPTKIGRKKDEKTGENNKIFKKIRRINLVMKYIPRLKKSITKR